MSISVVIPNFNSAELLKKNLPMLLKLLDKTNLEHEVIVADDASTDNSVAIVQELGVRIVKNGKNTGFAGNVDRGIRAAKGEIVFTLKTDVLPKTADYFELILKHFDNPKTFAVSAALETLENGKKEIRGQGVLIFHRGFFQHFRTFDDYRKWLLTMRTTRNQASKLETERQNPNYSAWSDGGASAFRKDLYLKIGGFDSLYNPFYWEDTDLGYRAWKAGYEVRFEPKAILEHKYEAGAIRRHYKEKEISVISLRNQFIFVWKNADLKHLLLYLIWEPYHELIALKNGDWTFFDAYLRAFLRLPGIIGKRIFQRKVSVLSDDRVLKLTR